MHLSPGAHLGPYEILELVGAGGMGEVYRARDTRLGRDVAIKVLPPAWASDPDRLARLEREARLLASLNHRNIAHVYGLEQSNGTRAVVMELVDGETLADRIARGPFQINEALPIARQLCEALEAAHERGVIHRDLKPANVKVRPDGTVKVLDFGVAKAVATESGDVMNSPTVSARATQGLILGTAAYMSPEQASGKPVDRRTDLWAFGVVLMEMLTGKRAFDGGTVSHVLASVLKDEPDFSALPADTPVSVRRLLGRCLEKDRMKRLADASDARLDIEEALEDVGRATPPLARDSRVRASVVAWALVLSGVTAAAYFAWSARQRPPILRAGPPLHFQVHLDPAESLLGSEPSEIRTGSRRPSRTAIALSPDGRWLAFTAIKKGTQELFLRDLRRDVAMAIDGTIGAENPFFSPDSKWIGFWSDDALRKIPADGGPIIDICKVARIQGADWGPENRVLFATQGVLEVVPADGGGATTLTQPNVGGIYAGHCLPHWVSRDRLVYSAVEAFGDTRVVTQRLDGSDARVLVDNATDGRIVDGRYLVYARGGTLMAVPFDSQRATVATGGVGLVDNVMVGINAPTTADQTGAAQFAINDTGLLVYLEGGIYQDFQSVLTWLDSNGITHPIDMETGPYLRAVLSPDGTRALIEEAGLRPSILVYDFARRTLAHLPIEVHYNARPMWAPDGRTIVFRVRTTQGSEVVRVPADGVGVPERLGLTNAIPATWSRNGDELVYLSQGIHAFSIKDKTSRTLVNTRGVAWFPAVSPNGMWLAFSTSEPVSANRAGLSDLFVQNASSRSEVFVQPYSGGPRVVVSTAGDCPIWTKDGRELIFRQVLGDGTRAAFWRVEVTEGTSLSLSAPRKIGEVAQANFGWGGEVIPWDIAADGRLLGVTRNFVTPPPPTTLHVITNWFEDLRAKVPTK